MTWQKGSENPSTSSPGTQKRVSVLVCLIVPRLFLNFDLEQHHSTSSTRGSVYSTEFIIRGQGQADSDTKTADCFDTMEGMFYGTCVQCESLTPG